MANQDKALPQEQATAHRGRAVQAARLCKELIQSGFENPKILLGNISADINGDARRWTAASAEDFIEEVSQFGAVTIAATEGIYRDLQALGIPAVNPGNGDLAQAVRSAAVSYSLNGYLPIFVVGASELEAGLQRMLQEKLAGQAFLVSGGIEAVSRALNTGALISAKRLGLHGASSCAG